KHFLGRKSMKNKRRSVIFRSRKTPKSIAKAKPQTHLQLLLSLLALTLCALMLFSMSGCGLTSNGEDQALSTGTSQNTISNLNIGDAHPLSFSNGLAKLTFEEADPTHHYIL